MSRSYKDINKLQREFYDTKHKNVATRLWSYFRNRALNNLKKEVGVERDIYQLHIRWFGNLSDKKVLDLGCYAGNSLSIYLAQNSRQYLGIDLSAKGINSLNGRLENISGARAEVMDFLSGDFKEENFDLIYAYGVLHHFEDVDGLIERLDQKLKMNGMIISHDPLETSLPIKILRRIYRPFQSDRAWEWPFSRKAYYKFNKAFEIKERRAVLGNAKWSTFIRFLPISEDRKLKQAKVWHKQDWERSAVDDRHMFSCMQLSMLMQKRE